MTITSLSSASPSRWGDLSYTRPDEMTGSKSRAVDRPARTDRTEVEAGREGPRRSPLFGAVKAALEELMAPAATPVATEGGVDAPSAGSPADSEALEQAIADFARALMHALREGPGPHGEGRGRHLGHALGRHGWGDAAQRVEQLARELAPEEAPAPATTPEAPADTAPAVPAEPAAEATPVTEITAPATAPEAPMPLSVRLPLEPALPPSPWKSAHDGLIESFAEVQRALGTPRTDGDDESLEERLQEMLVALAAKLRANAVTTAALAPPGALLSVVA